MQEPEGNIVFHHLLPGLRVMDARACAHRWVVFHESYDFCLVTKLAEPEVRWKYNHRIYSVDADHVIMAMQPGELHANLDRTKPGDFIVVQVCPELMHEVAHSLGWERQNLNLRHPHPASRHPGLLCALQRFAMSLCRAPLKGRTCDCAETPDLHADHLVLLVAAFIGGCAEDAEHVVLPSRAPAVITRAVDYLMTYCHQPYSLDQLARASGCGKGPYYLLHAFKQELGIPPGEFRRRVLVAKACDALVKYPRGPLELIAREAGWSAPEDGGKKSNLLITHFRRTLGVTPDKFRGPLRAHAAAHWQAQARAALARALEQCGLRS